MCFLALLIIGCKPSVPKDYIQPDEMEDILYDYYLSKAIANEGNNYSYNRNLYYEATLKKHNVSKAEFDSSLVYYYTHADQLAAIYKKLTERMGNDAKRLGASVGEAGEYANLTANGDTANIWRDSPTAILTTVAPFNRLDFTIPADTTFHRGDSFMLSFMASFMYQSGSKEAIAVITVTYKNDSVSVSSTNVSVTGINRIDIPSYEQDVKEIKGFIYLAQGSDDSKTQKLMFVDNIRLIRFHQSRRTNEPSDKAKPDSATRKPQPDTGKVMPQPPRMMKLTRTK